MVRKAIWFLFLGMFLACEDQGILEPDFPMYSSLDGSRIRDERANLGDYYKKEYRARYAIVGDTVLPYRKINWPELAGSVNLTALKSPINEGKAFRMVTFSEKAGFGSRDFGFFNEGMESAYPHLLARQMGIKYTLPLFGPEDYNGYGRLARSQENPTGGPAIKFKRVINNLGIVGSPVVGQYGGGNVELKAFNGEMDIYGPNDLAEYTRFTMKRNHQGTATVREKLRAGNGFDFFILEAYKTQFPGVISRYSVAELKLRDWEKFPENGFDLQGGGFVNYYYNGLDNVVRWFKDYKVEKGVIINIPYSDFKVKRKNRKEELLRLLESYGAVKDVAERRNTSVAHLYEKVNHSHVWIDGTNLTVDSLLGDKVPFAVKPYLGIGNHGYKYIPLGNKDLEENGSKALRDEIDKVNLSLKVYSEYLDVPIFNLNGLLQKIHAGNYRTHDGVAVSAEESGNFYSIDGVNPSAFGNAVIVNELILTINAFYKTDIPLMGTRLFHP